MLLDNPRLTFGEIATRWAKENAEEPGALSHDEILRRLESALKNGEFSVANLTIKQPSSAKRDVLVGIRPVGDGAYSPLYERRDSKSVPVTEEMLSHPVYWQSDGYAKVSCFEDTEVPRGDFIDWCIKHGQPQPQFWSHDRSQKPSDEENSPRLQFDTQHTPSAVPPLDSVNLIGDERAAAMRTKAHDDNAAVPQKTKKEQKVLRSPVGRKPGQAPFARSDKLLIKEMHKLVGDDEEEASVLSAAQQFADQAKGGSTRESKIDRLRKRYREEHPLKEL